MRPVDLEVCLRGWRGLFMETFFSALRYTKRVSLKWLGLPSTTMTNMLRPGVNSVARHLPARAVYPVFPPMMGRDPRSNLLVFFTR